MEKLEDYVDEGVFDQSTLKVLYELSNDGYFSALGGALSTGKEADVFLADRREEQVAVKVYRTATSAFQDMRNYLSSDPRVDSLGQSDRDVIYRWTQREYSNLLRAAEHVRVPEPLAIEKNVLVMEFIGEEELRAPLLREMEFDDWGFVAEKCVGMLEDLYAGDLVHGDFSEFNVLVMGELVLIDFSQSVPPEHPLAEDFLERDVENLVRFFGKKDVELEFEEVMERVKEAGS